MTTLNRLCRWLAPPLLVAAVLAAIAPPAAAGPSTTVVINELQVGGIDGAADEFVELYNGSTAAVDVGGWRLRRSSGTGATVSTLATIPTGVRIAPNASYLLAGSAYGASADQRYGSTISSTGGVALVRSDGTMVDALGLSTTSAFLERRPAVAAAPGESLQRLPDGTDRDDNRADFASASPTPVKSGRSRPNDVTIVDDAYAPSPVTVTEGDRVFWHNAGARPHTVTADRGGFASQPLAPGMAFAALFPTPGTFAYHCSLHPVMTGQVLVQPRRGRFHPLAPARLLDTRGGAKVGPGETRTLVVAGAGGVPLAGVSAVVLNVTVTQPDATGYLTVFAGGAERPPTSNLNFTPGRTVANLVTARVGELGAVALYNPTGAAHVIVDVTGYYDRSPAGPDGRFQPANPTRLLDTRSGTAFGPGESRSLAVASNVTAVVVNLTVTEPTATSFLTAWPAGAPQPATSNLNFVAGQTVANRAIVAVPTSGPDAGRINIRNAAGRAHVIVDLSGTFSLAGSGSGAVASVPPVRILDTRGGAGLGPGTTRAVTIAGTSAVPPGAKAAVLNVTITNPTAWSFLTVWPAGAAKPPSSDSNYTAGVTVASLVMVKLGTGGAINLANAFGTADVIVDVFGYVT